MADLTPEDARRVAAPLSLPMVGDDALPLEQGEPWPTRLDGELA